MTVGNLELVCFQILLFMVETEQRIEKGNQQQTSWFDSTFSSDKHHAQTIQSEKSNFFLKFPSFQMTEAFTSQFYSLV